MNVKPTKKRHAHGDAHGTRLYLVWKNLRRRCSYPKATHFESYGGRGISVCDKWNKSYLEFKKWAHANKYKEGLTIERIDVDAGYSPENCTWIEAKLQARNKTTTVRIEYNGQTKSVAEWAEIKGIKANTLSARVRRGVSLEKIFDPPIRGRPGKHSNKHRKDSVWLEYKGEKKTITEWAKHLGVSPMLFYGRRNQGWSVEKILETPLGSIK